MAYVDGDDSNIGVSLNTRYLARSGKSIEYASAAVEEYKAFFDIKVANEDRELDEEGFTGYSPSEEIDAVWHTHISFLKRYQCDTLYLTGRKRVIEHSPLLYMYMDAADNYNRSYEAHETKMSEQGKQVNTDFWTEPESFASCG